MAIAPAPQLLDLNLTASLNSSSNHNSVVKDSPSKEISSLLKIGKDVGFQLASDDPIVNNGDGVEKIP